VRNPTSTVRERKSARKPSLKIRAGNVPLGYDVKDRKLIVNETEASTVRVIIRGYAELGSVALLRAELDRVIRDTMQVIDHMLYWAAVQDEQEASFLAALFNSETTRLRVASLQSRGQWGARHFDKVMFNLPIPRFSPSNPLHNAIAEAAREAETIATSVALPENIKFQRARGLIRAALTEAGVAQKIDGLVAKLLDGA
jgi:hypothetical protein